MSRLNDFLKKNNIVASAELPIVHTTQGFNLQSIIGSSELVPTPCNTFEGEDLNYFFYGKPSYKSAGDFEQSKQWEMPICFLLSPSAISNIKRIYPFDSGAFLAGRHPDYIRKMGISDFEAAPSRDTPRRIIGAFFDSIDDFFRLKPKDENKFKTEFSLSLLDAQVLALRELAGDTSLATIDDRRFAVEIQSDQKLTLDASSVEAVVISDSYVNIEEVRNYISDVLKAEIIMYSTYSLAAADHTALIYEKVCRYLVHKGVL
ncbi:hypothetical protein GOB83_11890 [Acetobacter fabarum]|uniref:hypothetical protein n=2 Tax=Acetobacter fabarum TaxID=483199 RepID=UPI0014054716|nr:hypothetical protein [Acetobacter fabarum]NHO42872.1 hypothetical protein [Acetobacter fabarum]